MSKAMYICPQCQIGHLQPHKQTFVRVYSGMVVSIPDMPSFTCDVCAYQEFERASVAHIDALMGEVRPGRPVTRAATVNQAADGGGSPVLKP